MNLTEKNKKRIHLGVGIAISCMLVLVGILFITSCYSIYKSGASPFTRESISAAFSKIAAWVYVTLSLTVVGAGICLALPVEKEKLKGVRSPGVLVKKLSQRVNIAELDTELRLGIEKERRLRRILGWVRIGLAALSAILPLIYLLNPANFPAVSGEYNSEISHGMLVYLAFLAPFFAFEVVYVVLTDLSYTREHAHLKAAIADRGISENISEPTHCAAAKAWSYIKENKKPIVLGIRIAFVGCAIAFIIIGIANGGMADVLNKAIKICTECIGLG